MIHVDVNDDKDANNKLFVVTVQDNRSQEVKNPHEVA